jgi:hypothetical protein
MKKFISTILFFSLPIITAMFVADYFISKNLKKSNKYPGEFEVWNDIYNGNIKSDVAIYGSSRAWVHIDSGILEDSLELKTYNMGVDGHNFGLQYLRHIEYLKFNKTPKLIIVSVDAFSLQKKTDLYELAQFLPYMLWNENIKKYTSSFNGFNYYDYYVPLIRYMGRIKKISSILRMNQKLGKKYRVKGYKGIERDWNEDATKAQFAMEHYEISMDESIVALFNQFLIECRTKKVQVILVYTPEYIDGQKPVINRNEVLNKLNDFSKKYNLLFLDYSKDELCLQKTYFYNSSHLNKKGAEIFTAKLGRDLNRSTKIRDLKNYRKSKN